MATSGNKTQAFYNSRYYLKMDWTRTSYSESGNYSVITVNLYLGSYGNGYNMSASASKNGSMTVNGTTYSFTKSGISLSSGGQIKIFSKTGIRINHNTDGTKSFAMSASFNPSVTVSGTSIGNQTIASTTFTLNTIPQASTLTCNANWTAGANKAITISRKSSGFTHKVEILVNGTAIASKTGVGTGCTFAFSDSEQQKIFAQLNKGDSKGTQIKLTTYKGSSQVGAVQTISGTVTNVKASTTTYPSSVNIGATMSGTISRIHGKFTHSIRLLRSDQSTQIAVLQASTSTATSWSGTVPTSVYSLTPNSNSYTMYIEIATYWNGTSQLIRNPIKAKITAKVTGSNPTFSPSTNLTYKDTNTTTTGITGNNQYLVQGYSTLSVTLASAGLASVKNSATIKNYQVTFGGVTKTVTSFASGFTVNFGTITASSNTTLTVKVTDSRGNTASASKTVYVVPYSKPKVVANVTRQDGFGEAISSSLSGVYSPISVGGTAKNSIQSATRQLSTNGGAYSSTLVNFTVSNSNGKYTATSANFNLLVTSSGKLKIIVKDKLNTITVEVDIPTGMPLFYLDSEMGSASFNKLPQYPSTLELGFRLDLPSNQYWSYYEGSDAITTYGMHANNSDIVGINSLVFSDKTNNMGEGLRFPNSTYVYDDDHKMSTATGHETYGDYTNFSMYDGEMRIDGGKFFDFTNTSYGTSSTANMSVEAWGKTWKFNTYGTEYNSVNGIQIQSDSNTTKIDGNKIFFTTNNSPQHGYIKGKEVELQAYKGTALDHFLKIATDANEVKYFRCTAIGATTNTGSANVYTTSSGYVYRSTSSAKAKLDIVPAFETLDEYKQILEIEPRKWFDKSSTEQLAAQLTAEYIGEDASEFAEIGNVNRVYGCVAEELEEKGLNFLVDYDPENKEIAGVSYDRIGVLTLPLIKDLYQQIEDLKQEIEELKNN